MNLKKELKYSVAGIFIAVLIFAFFELLLRIIPGGQIFSPGWTADELVNHAVFWQPLSDERNPLGVFRHWKKYRGRPPAEKSPGVKRIVIFGGSHVYGWPYDSKEVTFPYITEKLLKEHGYNAEIVNCGEGGFTSFQGLMYLKREISDLKPDIVIFCFGANDGSDNQTIRTNATDREFYEKLKKTSENHTAITLQKQLGQLYLYNLLKFIIYSVKTMFSPAVQRVPPGDFRKNIEEFIMLGNKTGFIPVCMSVAHNAAEANKEYRQIYETVAKEHNVLYIDMHNLLQHQGKKDNFIDDMHFSEVGHQRAAEFLDVYLEGLITK